MRHGRRGVDKELEMETEREREREQCCHTREGLCSLKGFTISQFAMHMLIRTIPS